MTDLSEFEELSSGKNAACKVGRALDSLTPEELDLFISACAAHDRVSTGALAKWLNKRGYDYVNASSAVAHRARKCSCYGGF